MYCEDEYLNLSGIQHFYFCKRQWALIHIEQQWAENRWTAEGNHIHEKADMPFLKESRRDIFISRAMPIASKALGLSGITDIVEFHKSKNGIVIPGKQGRWLPCVVEYKRGKEKSDERDVVQLVAQVICLEEKYKIKIGKSYMYYFQTNKKLEIEITDELRAKVEEMTKEMHELFEEKVTPPAEFFKNCNQCSLYDICMPRITKKKTNVVNYLYGDKL